MKMRSTRHKTEIKSTGIKTNLTLKSNIHDNTEVQDENCETNAGLNEDIDDVSITSSDASIEFYRALDEHRISEKDDQDEFKWNALKEWCLAVNNSQKYGNWDFRQVYKIEDFKKLELN